MVPGSWSKQHEFENWVRIKGNDFANLFGI